MEYLRGFELGLGVYEVDVRREYALIDIIQIINHKHCSSNMRMSCSSKIQMSRFATGKLAVHCSTAGAVHEASDAGSRTGRRPARCRCCMSTTPPAG